MPVLPEEALYNILDTWPVAVLSTYGTRFIDSVPVVFVRAGSLLYSPVDGKPKSGRALSRVSNLKRDDRYTLLLQDYQNDWQALWWVKLSGRARVLEDIDESTGQLPDIVAALSDKYPQYQATPVLGARRQLLELEIDSLNAWAYRGIDWLAGRFI
ncbi:MAG: hypothetical protein WD002_08795 [Pseudomonadales bacterium]